MKKFKKIILWTLGVIAALIVLFFAGGMLANPEFSGTKSITVDQSPDVVWALMDDTQRFSESRHEVEKTEMLRLTSKGFKSWREHTPLLGTMTYEITKQIPGKMITIHMIESDFGMTGEWVFKIIPSEGKTQIVLTEKSSTDGLLMRSVLNVLGRDANMGLLLGALKKELGNP